MLNKNFYPTPRTVASKMATVVKQYAKANNKYYSQFHILEPSAGKGDLVDMLWDCNRRSSPNIYTCEIEPKLQSILFQSEKCSVIGNDFLKLETDIRFDAIVMNPPFDKGMDHFIKAFELLKNGVLVCLLNKANLSNGTTKSRMINTIIEDNGGRVEDLGNCFRFAERKTNVEVAMIVVEKQSEAAFDDIHLNGDKEHFEFKDISGATELEVNDVLLQYERRYKASIEQFKKASIEMKKFFNLVQPFIGSISSVNYTSKEDEKTLESMRFGRFNDFLTQLRGGAWKKILSTTSFDKIMTSKVKEEFTAKFEQQKNYAFTKKNMLELISLLFQNRGSIINDCLIEVFDLMTRYYKENRVHIEGWKSNDAFMVNRKFILPNMWCWTVYSLDYQKTNNLDDIDKALCYLTGDKYEKPTAEEQEAGVKSIVRTSEAIKADQENGERKFDSHFFHIKTYQKGTIHFKFKDKNLWERFNRTVSELRGFPLPAARKANSKYSKEVSIIKQ